MGLLEDHLKYEARPLLIGQDPLQRGRRLKLLRVDERGVLGISAEVDPFPSEQIKQIVDVARSEIADQVSLSVVDVTREHSNHFVVPLVGVSDDPEPSRA